MRVGGGEISDLFKNLTPTRVPEPDAVATAKLNGDAADKGAGGQGGGHEVAQATESPTPKSEASIVTMAAQDTAKAVPDATVEKDVPKVAIEQSAQEAVAVEVAADATPDVAAPNTTADQIEHDVVEDEPVSDAATDKVASKDD